MRPELGVHPARIFWRHAPCQLYRNEFARMNCLAEMPCAATVGIETKVMGGCHAPIVLRGELSRKRRGSCPSEGTCEPGEDCQLA